MAFAFFFDFCQTFDKNHNKMCQCFQAPNRYRFLKQLSGLAMVLVLYLSWFLLALQNRLC
jgi:hypothetical protein